MTGADAAKFLQGIITATALTRKNQNPRQDPFYAGFLNATGRVLYDVFVYPDPGGNIVKGARAGAPGFLIDVDADQALDLCKYIKRYKLRADVAVWQLQHGEGLIWQAWGTDGEPDAGPGAVVYKDPRAPDLGYRIFQPGYEAPELDLERAPEHAYTVRRYLSGVPEGQNEILKEVALPQESNMDFMGAIDWRKGCYIGQELTIRTRHRGVVRKRILPCVIYDEHAAPPEALHYEPEGTGSGGGGGTGVAGVRAHEVPQSTSIGRCGKRARTAGKWLAGTGNIGLGLCRIETMTGVQLPGETAAAPVQGDEQFKLEWAGDDPDTTTSVRVKAFVPDWIQAGLDGVKPPEQ